jgi:hypothetical protein
MRDGSGTRHYKYIRELTDRYGKVRVYFQRRRGAPMIRLHEKPGMPEFDQEYRRIYCGWSTISVVKAPQRTGQGTFRWLCEGYYASANKPSQWRPVIEQHRKTKQNQ